MDEEEVGGAIGAEVVARGGIDPPTPPPPLPRLLGGRTERAANAEVTASSEDVTVASATGAPPAPLRAPFVADVALVDVAGVALHVAAAGCMRPLPSASSSRRKSMYSASDSRLGEVWK